MKEEIAVSVKDLHIYYKDVRRFSIAKNGIKQISNAKVFKAVRGISFEIPKGQIVGICGKNGSGKSTTLRAIAGIFSADSGTIDLHNNAVSLLSIGVGFNRALTGYENILLSGLLLGYSEEKIRENMQEIIDFSELGDFINRPVREYSSGMYSKLAFSITAILKTEIILIDEVFSVGDIHFKQKSYNKMKELISDKNTTVLIVSHSLNTLKKLCDRVIWIDSGKIIEDGDPEETVEKYEKYMANLD